MKTTIAYLKYGLIPLVLVLMFFDASNGSSGILLALLSKYAYYTLSIYKYSHIIFPLFITSGVLLILVGIKRSQILSKLNNHGFYYNGFHQFGIKNDAMIFMSEQEVGVKKSASRTETSHNHSPKKEQNEDHAIALVSSGCIMFANKAFFKLTGYEPLDVLGKDFASFIRPESFLNYTMLSRMKPLQGRQPVSIGLITPNNKNIVACVGEIGQSGFNPNDVIFST
jgi:hypothetical protein